MQITDNRRKITVGIFIFIGLVIFILGIFTLGGQKKTFIRSFSVNVIFNDVHGLKTGDNVWYSGVKVGTIQKIEFYGASQVLVFMNIEEEVHKYIHKDAKASIGSDGLIGNKIIVITSGNPQLPVIENGDRIVVNTTLSTEEIMKTFQENNKNLIDITTDFKTLSANLVAGKGTAGALLSDEQIAQNFRAIVLNLKTATQATNKMAANLTAFSETLNTKGGLANKMLTDTVVFARLQTSVGELQKAAKSASALTDNLTSASSNFNNASANFNNASAKLNQTDNPAGLLLNDQQTAGQIKQIIKNLESSSHNLDEDLKALQNNFLLRGYFRKKGKENK
jgi:phospholipid/cholesterol/gamma-HCH transport system substrate-binding protein